MAAKTKITGHARDGEWVFRPTTIANLSACPGHGYRAVT